MSRLYKTYEEKFYNYTITPQLGSRDELGFGKPNSWKASLGDSDIITAPTISAIRKIIRNKHKTKKLIDGNGNV